MASRRTGAKSCLCASYDHDVTAARAGLDEATFAEAWAAGRAMTLDQAITYALNQLT